MATIMYSDRYVLSSYGHGEMYSLQDTYEGDAVYIMKDDAYEFRCDLEALEVEMSEASNETILARLFELYH
jgi:hypothetical protein